ncbi:sensor domain-containing protein, partial [Sphaerisporangium rhizosphaerae]
MPDFMRTFDWVFKDPATWRDLAWLLGDPLIGGVAVLVPPLLVPLLLVASGVALVAQGPVQAVAGVLLVLAGPLLAPRAVRLHGVWT